MRKIFTIIVINLISSNAYSQNELKSMDSSLKSIDTNIGKLKDELVKEDPEPYTGQSIFEDSKGSSAIFLPSVGTFRLNTADASLKLSFINRVSTKKLTYGFDISGKTNDGLMPLISNGNISPGAKVNGIIGLQELFHKSNILDGWFGLKIGYEGSSFKLFNPDSIFANQIKKTSFNSFTSALAFNLKIEGNKLLALSIGYQKVNNYSDLDEIELTDTKEIKDSISNTTRTYETKNKVRMGKYKTFDQLPINLDFFWTPNSNPRIGLYHYWRGKFTNGEFTNGCGSGLYLLKKNNPLSAVAGVVLEVSDISKFSDGYGKNFTINFVVGYNFGFAKK